MASNFDSSTKFSSKDLSYFIPLKHGSSCHIFIARFGSQVVFFPGIKKRHVIDTVPLAIVLRDVAYRIIGTHRK